MSKSTCDIEGKYNVYFALEQDLIWNVKWQLNFIFDLKERTTQCIINS